MENFNENLNENLKINLQTLLTKINITKYNNHFQKENIKKIIENDTYAIIDTLNNENFITLGNILTSHNFPNSQIIGSYNSLLTIFSYFVIKPEEICIDEFYKILFELGTLFNQESIIISCKGIAKLVFTNGINIGKFYIAKGFNNKMDKNFSIIKCNDGDLIENCIIIGQYYFEKDMLKK